VVGLGLAAPYVLLTAFPGWLRFVPKPGPWMVVFKQIVGFILVAVVIWLMWILSKLVESGTILGMLGLLLLVGIGCWLLGKDSLTGGRARTAKIWIAALVVMFGGGWGSFHVFAERASIIPWQAWEPGIGKRLAADGYTVYLDYTAYWCITCQTNKRFVLETRRVAAELKKLGVYPVKVDFTSYDKRIQHELQAYGRNAVPLNIVIPAGRPDEAIVLPELLRTERVLEALRQAGPSQKMPDFWLLEP
jgi:thiol:disulfide interchange protein DsbD